METRVDRSPSERCKSFSIAISKTTGAQVAKLDTNLSLQALFVVIGILLVSAGLTR